IIVVNFNYFTTAASTASITNSSNTWTTPASAQCADGTASHIQNYAFITKVTNTTVSESISFTGGASAAVRVFAYDFTGGAPPTLSLDQAHCDYFSTNSATQTIGSITLLNHDAVVASIVCASGNTGTGEFSPVSPLVSGTGENGGSNSSYRSAHIVDNT